MRKKIYSILTILFAVLCFSSCSTTLNQNVTMETLRGRWYISKINDEKIPKNLAEQPFIEFYMRDMHVRGNTGCNVMNGTYFQQKGKINSLVIGRMRTGDNVCQDMTVETKILTALGRVAAFGKISSDKVYLLDSMGQPVMLLSK